MGIDYSPVTEVAGIGASREQLEMLYSRYRYAVEFCRGKNVLEVACGSGHGLGYLAGKARLVVGGDYTPSLLHVAQKHYSSRLPLVQLDAHLLPFKPGSFDVILLYEALYYLAAPEQFLAECRRILRPEGVLLLCSVNKEWADFNPSPFSTRYFSSQELLQLCQQAGFQSQILGAFPVVLNSQKHLFISLIKRIAVALHLIPKTMKGKEFLKRVFLGKLTPLPSEVIDGMAKYTAPTPISFFNEALKHKVIYAVGRNI